MRCSAKWWRSIRRAALPNARPGRPAGGRIGRATSRTPSRSSIAAPRSFRAPTTGRRGSIGAAAPSLQAGDVETGVARLRLAATDYHNSYYGRLAVKNLASRPRRRDRAVAAAPARAGQRADGPAHRLAAGGRPQRGGDERAAVRAAGVGRLAAAAGDHRADAPAPGQRARRHQRDEARLSAVPGGRRRNAAARRSCRSSSRSTTGRCCRSTPQQRSLDPYLVAALVAQESNFDPVVRVARQRLWPDAGAAVAPAAATRASSACGRSRPSA